MKGFQLILFTTLLLSCSGKSHKKKSFSLKDIEGYWVCAISSGNSLEKEVNLYLKNNVCHFGSVQDNRTNYSLKNGILVAKDHSGHVYQAKVIAVKSNMLKLKLLSDWQYQFRHTNSDYDGTVIFRRKKIKNGAVVKQVNLSRTGGYGPFATYGLQYLSNGQFLFNGVEQVKHIGYYTGKTDKKFWNILVDKIHYLPVPKIKDRVGRLVEDAGEIKLEIITDLGKLSCFFSLSDYGDVPAELLDLAHYIHSNYEQFNYTPLNETDFFKKGGTVQSELVEKTLSLIPC